MKFDTVEIAEGKHNDKHVWICDFRSGKDWTNRPIRHVKPMEVLVQSNEHTKQHIHYSDSHFVKLRKNGLPSVSIIKLFDNTGYRSFTGTALRVFDNEAECRACYREMGEKIIEEKGRIVGWIQEQIDEIEKGLK